MGIFSARAKTGNRITISDAENAAAIRALTEELGVTISAFWCGWEGPKAWNFYEGQATLGLVPSAYREQRVKELCAGADFAKKLGAPTGSSRTSRVFTSVDDESLKYL